MNKEEVIEILSEMRSEYNLFGDEEEATRYHVLSWAIKEMNAEPVRHGHWIWNEDEWNHQCSVCKERFDYSKTYELFDHGFQMANYCPCCGARMDGGKDDE